MKHIALTTILMAFSLAVCCQNVGIATTDVSRAKLTVIGTANANSNTVALFGVTGGLSLQQAWPTIGFNQYRAIPTGNGYAISSGYGMHMTFNYTTGDFAMLRNGYADAGLALPLQQSFFTFLHNTNSLRLNSEIPGGRVDMANKIFTAQTGNMNLVPLGMINITFNRSSGINPSHQISVSNAAGNLYTTFLGSRTDNISFLKLSLDTDVMNGYTSLLVLPGLNFTNLNSALFSLETTVLNESPKRIQIKVATTSETNGFYINGNLLVYGVQ